MALAKEAPKRDGGRGQAPAKPFKQPGLNPGLNRCLAGPLGESLYPSHIYHVPKLRRPMPQHHTPRDTAWRNAAPMVSTKVEPLDLKMPPVSTAAAERIDAMPAAVGGHVRTAPAHPPAAAAGSLAKSAAMFALRLTGKALQWVAQGALDIAKRLTHVPPKDSVDALVVRAVAGPPAEWVARARPAARTWGEFAKDQALAAASLLEPSFVKEARKISGYEKGVLGKVSAVLSHVAKGLPNPSGSHITPERVRALPYEYNDPHLQKIYLKLRRQFFPNRADLDDYKVVWRDRPAYSGGKPEDERGYIQYAARCIYIAREMSHPDAVKWIPALIHHELSHGVLNGFLKPGQDSHAEWFRRISYLHPDTSGFESWRGWFAACRSYHGRP